MQFDPESSPELTLYHGHPQVVLAYLKYQYAVGDELKRRDAFCRLQVSLLLSFVFDPKLQNYSAFKWFFILPFWFCGIGFVCAACYRNK